MTNRWVWTCGQCGQKAIGVGDALPPEWLRNVSGTSIGCSPRCLVVMRLPCSTTREAFAEGEVPTAAAGALMEQLMARAGSVGAALRRAVKPMDDFSAVVALLTAACGVAQESQRPRDDVRKLFDDLWDATAEAAAAAARGQS